MPARFAPGSRIAGYLLEEQIGEGGMAVVFRAHDERLDRTVALKILAPRYAEDQAFRQRFIRESRAAAAVDDEHIIPVFEAGEAAGVLFIAMRYVRGGDVRSAAGGGPLPSGRAAEMVSQVAQALDAAHARGLVHRDVKPANMLLEAAGGARRSDHVYLSDFGLSKGSLQASRLTGTGPFLGTLDYVAPEQISGQPVDGRADQYSLACAAFEMLTGTPPFARADAMAVVYAQLSEQPPPISRYRADLPAAVDAVFARALAKAAVDRYPFCREFADDLSAALREPARQATTAAARTPTTSARVTVPTVPTEPNAGPATSPVPGPRRNRRLVVLAGGLVVALAAGGVMLFVLQAGAGAHRSGLLCQAAASRVNPARYQSGDSYPSGGVVEAVAFNPDGSSIAIGSHDGNTDLWSTANSNPLGTFTSSAAVQTIAFSCDGRQIAAGDSHGIVHVWEVASEGLRRTLAGPHGQVIYAVAFSPDGKTLAAGDANGNVYVWTIKSGKPLILINRGGTGHAVQAVAFSPDGSTLACGDASGRTYLWSTSTHQVVATLADPNSGSNGVQALAFSPDGSMLAAGDSNGYTYLWNTATSSLARTMADTTPGGAGVVAVAYSPDGGTIATGDSNGTTYLWDARTGSLARTLHSPSSGGYGVQAVAFSPDGKTLAVGDVNGFTYLWQA